MKKVFFTSFLVGSVGSLIFSCFILMSSAGFAALVSSFYLLFAESLAIGVLLGAVSCLTGFIFQLFLKITKKT